MDQVEKKVIPLHDLYAVDTFLNPITVEEPAGASLRYDRLYDKIKEARREDEALPQGIWEKELKKANWGEVASLCGQALSEQTKDLQIASWLTQAWIHLEGLTGLNRGLFLITSLCEKFWDHLHPLVEGEDLEYRFAPLEWADEHLAKTIRLVKLTAPSDPAIPAFSLADMLDASALEKNARRHKDPEKLILQAHTEGRPTSQKVSLSVQQTPLSFFQQLFSCVKESLSALNTLESALQHLAPDHHSPFYHIRAALEEIYRYCQTWLPGAPEMSSDKKVETAVLEKSLPLRQETTETQALSSITSRAEAYALLNQAADYLMRTEPHSPTPYLVKRAVSWGSMNLNELYKEIMQDEREATFLKQLLGGKTFT